MFLTFHGVRDIIMDSERQNSVSRILRKDGI
nr:MAG TPA_asm: hypothetical protein [Caudoviricetes sp.]